MAIKSPKNKGSAGEREVVALLTGWAAEVGVDLFLDRNLEQVRYGGADVNGVPGLEVEVKRVEKLDVNAAWRQVCKACDRSGKRPFLIHRRNRQKWNVRVGLYAAEYDDDHNGVTVPLVVDLTVEQAKVWFQTYLKQRKLT